MPKLQDMLPKGAELGKVFTGHGKAFISENVRMPAKDWINVRLTKMLLKSGDLKKYKSVLQKAQGQDGKKAIDMIYKKVVLPLHKAMKIDPTKVKDLRSYIAKYGEDKFTNAWNQYYKQGVSGSYLYALAGTIFQGIERYDYVSKPLGLKEGKIKSSNLKDIVNEAQWLPLYKTADLALTPIAKKFKGKRIKWTGGVALYFYFGKVDDVVARKNAIKAELAMRKAGFIDGPGEIDNSSPGGKKGIYLSVMLADDEAFQNVKGIDKL